MSIKELCMELVSAKSEVEVSNIIENEDLKKVVCLNTVQIEVIF